MNEPRLPERWVHLYTRGLTPELRAARRDEIASDVFEQCHHGGRGVRAAVIGRTLRGVPGDVLWRFEEGRAMRQQTQPGRPTGARALWAACTQAWFTPFAVLVGLFDVVMAVGIAFDEGSKMPGRLVGPLFLLGFGACMFVGLWLRWRARFAPAAAPVTADARASTSHTKVSGGALLVACAAGAIGLIVLGTMWSPFFAVLGVPMLLVVVVAAIRSKQAVRSNAAKAVDRADGGEGRVSGSTRSVVLPDVLIVAGTLPTLGLFWMIVPPLVAIVVIAGVLGTGAGTRSVAIAAD